MQTLKKTAATLALLGLAASGAHAQTVVISEIYPGGGSNTAATFTTDYIELYNNGATAVDLSTLSLQYASATGNFTSIAALSGTIQPKDYFLFKSGTAGTAGTDLQPFNGTIGLNLSATAGKVALAFGTSAITVGGSAGAFTFTNTAGAALDVIGYGSTASAYEGAGAAPAPATTTPANGASLSRVFNSTTKTYVDSNNNSTDFVSGTPSPQVAAAPEPSSLVSMFLGAGALGLIAVRRRHAARQAV